jgi:outer membrane protein TolC
VQEDGVRDMRDRLQAGTARPLDVAQTEAEAAATRASLIEAGKNIVTARAALAFLIGAAKVDNPLIDGFAVPAVPVLDELQSQAAAQRQDVRAAQALVTAAQKGLRAAFAEYYPSVTVNFDSFLSRGSFPDDSRWLFGASANLPIFAGGRIHAGVRTAYSLLRQAKLYESLTQRQVVEEVKVAHENLQASNRRLRELQTEVAAARDAFDLAEQAYQVGLATNLERLIAQDRLLEAELLETSESLNRKILYLKLIRAAGSLLEQGPYLSAPADAPPDAGPQ